MLNKVVVLIITVLTGLSLAQDINKKIDDEGSNIPILVGECTREAFQDTNYSWWWNDQYNNYDVDTTVADSVKDKLVNYGIEVVMGSWCSDSRRQVPRLFKILDYIHYPSDDVKIICVDRELKTGGHEIDSLDIKRIPTIIIYKDGKEKGRIIERPKISLEKDLLNILDNQK